MTNPWMVRSTTATIRTESWNGVRRIPRDTIRVVAPAGGWGTLSQTMTPEVNARESAAAPTRPIVTAVASAGGASVRPKIARDA